MDKLHAFYCRKPWRQLSAKLKIERAGKCARCNFQAVTQADWESETVGIIRTRYKLMLDSGIDKTIADEVKKQAVDELELYYANQETEITLTGFNFSIGEIKRNYHNELTEAIPLLTSGIENMWSDVFGNVDLSDESIGIDEMLQNDFRLAMYELEAGSALLGSTTGGAVQGLLEEMKPQAADLTALAQIYRDLGVIPPREITKGLEETYQLEVLSGSTEHLYELMGMQMSDSPEFLKMVEKAKKSGMAGVDSIIKGVEMQNGTVYDATTNTWNEVTQSTADMAPKMAAEMNELGMNIGDSLAVSLAEQYGLVYDNGKWLILGASDGAYSALPGVINVLAAAGVDIPDALIAAMSGKTAEIQNQAALLLTELSTATEEQRPEILEKLAELGIEVPETLVEALQSQEGTLSAKGVEIGNLISESTKKGIEEKESEVKTAGENVAKSGMTAMQGAINGTTLTGPNIDGNNTVQSATRAMYATLTEMQRTANRNPIIIPVMQGLAAGVTAGLSARQSADGGVFDSPTLTWIGETNQKEYIIPVERTAAAVPLLESAAADMGYTITKQSNYAAEAGRAMSQINHIRNDNRMVLNIQNFNNNSDRDLDSITDYMEKRVLRSTMQQKRKGG